MRQKCDKNATIMRSILLILFLINKNYIIYELLNNKTISEHNVNIIYIKSEQSEHKNGKCEH